MKFRSFILMGVAFFVLFMGCGNEHANSSDNTPISKLAGKHSFQKSKGNPSIFVPENSYEFPSVVDGTKVTHDFFIHNKGDADLKINRVNTG